MLTEKLHMFISKFSWLSVVPYHLYGYDDVIPNGRLDPKKSLCVKIDPLLMIIQRNDGMCDITLQ